MSNFEAEYSLIGQLSDIGVVKKKIISDGTTDFPCDYVELCEEVELCFVNGKFYIDQPHQIKRLTSELAQKYGIEKHFVSTVAIVVATEPVKKKRGKK